MFENINQINATMRPVYGMLGKKLSLLSVINAVVYKTTFMSSIKYLPYIDDLYFSISTLNSGVVSLLEGLFY